HRTTSVGGRGGVGFGLLPPHCTPYGTPFPSLNPSVLSLTGHSSTVQQALESLVVWDSVFFHRTALCGYEVEQAYAFCPLLPFPVTVQGALESLVVWDSVFFHRIALCGYEFEQAYAFFPLLPSLMRLLATATPFRLLLPILGAPATFALVGLLLSNAAFVAAAFYLFRYFHYQMWAK
ncbi:unnamed protein product, partial [Closterium sp. NIES-54]